LVDFEEGLSFATHRLLELKQMQQSYLKNPYYAEISGATSEYNDDQISSLVQHLI